MNTDPAACLALWQPYARCRRSRASFFGAKGRYSKPICSACPCREVCFWSAMVLEEKDAAADASTPPMRFGLWGGTGPAERVRIASLYGPPSVEREAMLGRRFTRAFTAWLDELDRVAS